MAYYYTFEATILLVCFKHRLKSKNNEIFHSVKITYGYSSMHWNCTEMVVGGARRVVFSFALRDSRQLDHASHPVQTNHSLDSFYNDLTNPARSNLSWISRHAHRPTDTFDTRARASTLGSRDHACPTPILAILDVSFARNGVEQAVSISPSLEHASEDWNGHHQLQDTAEGTGSNISGCFMLFQSGRKWQERSRSANANS